MSRRHHVNIFNKKEALAKQNLQLRSRAIATKKSYFYLYLWPLKHLFQRYEASSVLQTVTEYTKNNDPSAVTGQPLQFKQRSYTN